MAITTKSKDFSWEETFDQRSFQVSESYCDLAVKFNKTSR